MVCLQNKAKYLLLGRSPQMRCPAGGRIDRIADRWIASIGPLGMTRRGSRRWKKWRIYSQGFFSVGRLALLRPPDPMPFHTVNQGLAADIQVASGVGLIPVTHF